MCCVVLDTGWRAGGGVAVSHRSFPFHLTASRASVRLDSTRRGSVTLPLVLGNTHARSPTLVLLWYICIPAFITIALLCLSPPSLQSAIQPCSIMIDRGRAQLLYLNYESASKPVYMYINTPGTSTPDGRAIGFETEAFAISDCMNYIKPPVYTIGVGQVR